MMVLRCVVAFLAAILISSVADGFAYKKHTLRTKVGFHIFLLNVTRCSCVRLDVIQQNERACPLENPCK